MPPLVKCNMTHYAASAYLTKRVSFEYLMSVSYNLIGLYLTAQ